MAEKKPYTSIIDALLDEREPDWKDLDLKDAKASGEEQLKRTHQYVDEGFMDDIAESASRHTPVPPSKSAAYEARIAEKERANPRLSAVKSDWHKDARRDSEDFRSSYGDNDSLMAEVTMSLEKADTEGSFGENNVSKKDWSDGQVQTYVKQLLNQGMSPSKVAFRLEKLAELELFNHQSATDYLQRNAGLVGLAYLEPNTYMDKNSPTYERTASAGESKEFDTSTEAGLRRRKSTSRGWKTSTTASPPRACGLDRVRITEGLQRGPPRRRTAGTTTAGSARSAGSTSWTSSPAPGAATRRRRPRPGAPGACASTRRGSRRASCTRPAA